MYTYNVYQMKVCIRCHKKHAIEMFEKKKRELHRRNVCKYCRNEASRVASSLRRAHVRKHGVGKGTCAIVGCSNTNLVFDHCHDTNAFRGWICRQCNSSMGQMGDTYRQVQSRANYLKRFEAAMVLAYIIDIEKVL